MLTVADAVLLLLLVVTPDGQARARWRAGGPTAGYREAVQTRDWDAGS